MISSEQNVYSPEVKTYSRLPIKLESGNGVYVYDVEGNEYVDLYGGHCVTILGHCPPKVSDAIKTQSEKLIFYSNVVESEIRDEATSLLANLAPFKQSAVFYCNSGAEANENAIKISWKLTGKSHVIAVKGSFHGRTLASLSATDSDKMHSGLTSERPTVHFVESSNYDHIKDLFDRYPISAIILEPIQSMNGMHVIPKEDIAFMRQVSQQNSAFLIFDEVQTGVGRTGTFSYSDGIGIYPDLITMAKSLASGIPIGAIIMPQSVSSQLDYGDLGTTFGGGMIAMAAHQATLNEIIEGKWMKHASQIFEHCQKLAQTIDLELKGKGCLMGIDLKKDSKSIRSKLLEERFIVGGSSNPNVIRLMPPINTPLEIFDHFFDALEKQI